ncbi:MAG: hypothetical protein ACK5RX_05410, partial [bacterium]
GEKNLAAGVFSWQVQSRNAKGLYQFLHDLFQLNSSSLEVLITFIVITDIESSQRFILESARRPIQYERFDFSVSAVIHSKFRASFACCYCE